MVVLVGVSRAVAAVAWVRLRGHCCERHHRPSDRLTRLMVSNLTTMVLMVFVTSIALAVIWGTYVFRRCPLEREQSDVVGGAERIGRSLDTGAMGIR
jgi:hypothetical protein